MACHVAQEAHVDVFRTAFGCFVADLVAFKAKLLGALKGVVRVLPAKNAV
jgi:hypothetical protein